MDSKSDRSIWIKCISNQGSIRAVAVQATDLIEQMVKTHKMTDPGCIQSLGEAVIAAVLLGSYCKPGERSNLNIKSSGFVSQALVDAYPEGHVRGYVVKNPHYDPSQSKNLGPWGEGLLCVLKTKLESGQKPYIGTVPMPTGHLAKDFSFYWVQSEQIPTSVGIAVEVSPQGKVLQAGGFLVQAMPGAQPDQVELIEKQIETLTSLSQEFKAGSSPIQLLSKIFDHTSFMILEEKPITMKCECGLDKVKKTLMLLGKQELESIYKEQGLAVIHCDFCSTEYKLGPQELQELIGQFEA